MDAVLAIESSLNDDGDGVVGYRVAASNLEFAAGTELWGTPNDHLDLAAGLIGFLERPSEPAIFQLGASGVGYVRLEFFSLDTLGHGCVEHG